MRASVLQKSGVTNAMEDFLNEEKKNINQNLEKLTKGTPGTVVIPIQDFIPQKCLLTMSTGQLISKCSFGVFKSTNEIFVRISALGLRD